MDSITMLRASYLILALLVLFAQAIPMLRVRFLDYGARSSKTSVLAGSHPVASNLLDAFAALCVPHSWFASFYAVSVTCSLFFAGEILLRGKTFRMIADNTATRTTSMTVNQIILVWALMMFQGSRRLYESIVLTKPSPSKMWVGHWAVGMFFYLATALAVWVEGVPILREHAFTLFDFTIRAPSLRTFVGISVFLFASGLQNDCHVYLASLKAGQISIPSTGPAGSRYRLPKHPAFSLSLTPHYFAECLIYLALAILAAPKPYLLNVTMTCALVFVMVNLGVTADGTRRWYVARFGLDTVKGQARMIPYLY